MAGLGFNIVCIQGGRSWKKPSRPSAIPAHEAGNELQTGSGSSPILRSWPRKVFAAVSEPNYAVPWAYKPQDEVVPVRDVRRPSFWKTL